MSIVKTNLSLATSAATLEAGRIAISLVAKKSKTKMPILVGAYLDTPIGKLVLANLAQMAQQHFRPEDSRLETLTNAMIVSSYQEFIQSFDIEGFLDELLSDSKIKAAMKKLPEND